MISGASMRVDPLTGKDNYLVESTRDQKEAQKILTRLLPQVDEQCNARTKATLATARRGST